MTDEFDLINKYFAPFSERIGDDCAILELAPGERLATSVDTLVEGVHFYSDAPIDQVAYRAVVTALSDLAAMGADPRAITLALTLPEAKDAWLREFSRGIEQATQAYDVELIGGDTTRGPLTITVQVMGAVPEQQALERSGAQTGDLVYVSGTLGDAAAAVNVMKGEWPGSSQHKEYLLSRYYHPSARIDLGKQLLTVATSAIDISDGLLADAGHLCERSKVGITLDADKLPLSPALQSLTDQDQAKTWALSGGDDYELLFTVPADKADQVPTTCTHIGEVTQGSHATCNFKVPQPGYNHFATPTPSDPKATPTDPQGSEGGGLGAVGAPTKGTGSEGAPPKPTPFQSPTQFLAFGFGSGLSPNAPGTMGTLAAIPLYLLMSELTLPIYTALVIVAFIVGIWICDRASEQLKVHDHGGIVWDEFVGLWITMWALPTTWLTVLLGFVVFRVFDILKPWPIKLLDKNVGGGFGIMIDDVLAGVAGCAVLHGALYLGVLS
jgi:thiamine-monophosphate kinase